MGQRVFLKEYDFNLTAGGIAIVLAEAEYFRIQASSGPVSIMIDGLGELPNLQAGQGIKSTPFKRLTIRDVSGAANVGRILVSNQEFIDNRTYGVNSLDSATMSVLTRPVLPGQAWNNNATLAANVPLTVFLPAANTNGAIVWNAEANDVLASQSVQCFLAKNLAPGSVSDGEIVTQSTFSYYNSGGGNIGVSAKLGQPARLAAGLGLYFISATAGTAGQLRNARFTLL